MFRFVGPALIAKMQEISRLSELAAKAVIGQVGDAAIIRSGSELDFGVSFMATHLLVNDDAGRSLNTVIDAAVAASAIYVTDRESTAVAASPLMVVDAFASALEAAARLAHAIHLIRFFGALSHDDSGHAEAYRRVSKAHREAVALHDAAIRAAQVAQIHLDDVRR